jgi:hypothetical protein
VCSKNNKEDYFFELNCSMSEYTGKSKCPICGKQSKTRIYTPPAIHMGMTAAEKSAGTTKQRVDYAKYVRDARDKRKRQADPNSRDAKSNELWTGSEVERGVISGPNSVEKAGSPQTKTE